MTSSRRDFSLWNLTQSSRIIHQHSPFGRTCLTPLRPGRFRNSVEPAVLALYRRHILVRRTASFLPLLCPRSLFRGGILERAHSCSANAGRRTQQNLHSNTVPFLLHWPKPDTHLIPSHVNTKDVGLQRRRAAPIPLQHGRRTSDEPMAPRR